MNEPTQSPLKLFSAGKVLFPVLFSLSVAAYMIYREYDSDKIKALIHQGVSWEFILLCFAAMVIRDLAYIWRMKLLSGNELSWRSAFDVTLLWEFSNTIAPSLTGGTPLMIYMLIKEKINAGKSTAIIFLTIFLDQFFFVLLAPLMLLIIGEEKMFSPLTGALGTSVISTMIFTYIILALYGGLLAFGLFLNPKAVRKFIYWLFNTRLLRRWAEAGEKTGNDLVTASETFRGYGFGYWMKVIGSTVLGWSSRFMVLNILLIMFSPGVLPFSTHLLAWGRQSVLFILMFVAFTPGGSGLAEFSFIEIMDDICPDPPGSGMIAFLWRIVGFYPYMLLGVWLLPRWIKRIFGNENNNPEIQ
ncbi:MAG: flippase-like domain-containing protein [Bacteroidia bacterium]|nr:flippase-like domain-containing protein [Bacteroidia bacterium]